MPSFIIFVFVLACLLTGMALLAVFKVDGKNRTVNAVLIAIGSVVGLALLLNCRTWWQVTDSVLNSQRKRLHSAANRMHKLKSEGFMKVRQSSSRLMINDGHKSLSVVSELREFQTSCCFTVKAHKQQKQQEAFTVKQM